jgi:hypothetical protein
MLQTTQLYQLGWRFFAGYIGGSGLHVWQLEDWQRVAGAGFALLPIWVAPLDAPSADHSRGARDGNAALSVMQRLGLSRQLVLDVEDGVQAEAYVSGFGDALHAGSCELTLYGNQTTLTQTGAIDQVDHWWLALWPPLAGDAPRAPADFEVWQWGSGPRWDENVAVDGFPFAQLGSS